MFSSARIGEPAATCPTSGSPLGVTASLTASAARSSSSIARGFEGSRRSRPTFSRLARCACTVDDEARPTALPMSRTVGGYPYFAEYFLMKSKISCWRFVRSLPMSMRLVAPIGRWVEHVFEQGSVGRRRKQLPRTPTAYTAPTPAPMAELVDALG